ncbi:MAG: hypothetical protein HQL54_04140 [Magnetococcales bacterium]|nr:hypothetical protein [Magnetococcales bacterium]
MKILDAIETEIINKNLAIVTSYDLFIMLCDLYHTKRFAGHHLRTKKPFPDFLDLSRYRNQLLDKNFLVRESSFSDLLRLRTVGPHKIAEHTVCYVDPFCYLSHLSAMERYSITNRSPKMLILTTPNQNLWRKLRIHKMSKDYQRFSIPPEKQFTLKRQRIPSPLSKRDLCWKRVKEVGTFIQERNSGVRVASIGQTFLDTLLHPELCGDMSHVMQVWEEHAEIYLEEIIEALDSAPTKIAKVRAGYLLQEVCGLNHPRIEHWRSYAQRGSSSKLDPHQPFSSTFSETWSLSINCQSAG